MTLSTESMEGRLDWLRQKAVEAWFARSPEAEVDRIIADVEDEYGSAEAAKLREELERMRAIVPSWLRFLASLRWKPPLWQAVLLCVVVFFAALFLSVWLNGGL